MFNRFTDRAKKVMSLARQEAQRFNHDYIGTEHILLGLILEGTGAAANILKKDMGLELATIRADVEKILRAGPSIVPLGQLPLTPGSKKVLEHSMAEAGNLGNNYIGTEHILLGLIAENEGIAAHVLLDRGAKLGDVRIHVMRHAREYTARDRGLLPEDMAQPLAHMQGSDLPATDTQILTAAIGILRRKGREALALELERIARGLD
jgi:ATP-dependent Clp protease ATP-binding subunit ClpA